MNKRNERYLRKYLICIIFLIAFDLCSIFVYYIIINRYGEGIEFLSRDLLDTYQVMSSLSIPFFVLDKKFLSSRDNAKHKFELGKPILLAFDVSAYREDFIEKIESVVKHFEYVKDSTFKTTIFYVDNPFPEILPKSNTPVSIIWKRSFLFHCLILHPFVEGGWWFGNLMDDPNVYEKFTYLGIIENEIEVKFQGVLNKFELVSQPIKSTSFSALVPKNATKFLHEFAESQFLHCNISRAISFKKTFYKNSNVEKRFMHRAWKLLATAKSVLDFLSIKFWISSGTCLGYFRECDFIPHSIDVDIGIFAKDYSPNIITEMELHGLSLKHWFGRLDDSLELSFVDKNGLKLDIFFFYEDEKSYWNGGTHAKTGYKFKYIFPKFKLCWSIFRDLKIRIPCDTLSYIYANYGPDWSIPLQDWNWKTSPHNVIPNGYWLSSDWPEVIKIFF